MYSVRSSGGVDVSSSYGSHTSTLVLIAHAVIATPLQDRRVVDVPRQIEQQVAVADARTKELVEIVGGDAIQFELHT